MKNTTQNIINSLFNNNSIQVYFNHKFQITTELIRNDTFYNVIVAPMRAQKLYTCKYTRVTRNKDIVVEYLTKKIEQIEKIESQKQIEKELLKIIRKNYVNKYKIGDILHKSFGYSMTLNTFYQVLNVDKKTMTVKEIGSTWVLGDIGYTGKVSPLKNSFDNNDKEITARIKLNKYGEYVTIEGGRYTLTNENTLHYENHMD